MVDPCAALLNHGCFTMKVGSDPVVDSCASPEPCLTCKTVFSTLQTTSISANVHVDTLEEVFVAFVRRFVLSRMHDDQSNCRQRICVSLLTMFSFPLDDDQSKHQDYEGVSVNRVAASETVLLQPLHPDTGPPLHDERATAIQAEFEVACILTPSPPPPYSSPPHPTTHPHPAPTRTHTHTPPPPPPGVSVHMCKP